MSQQAGVLDLTFKADQDLRTKQYFLVKMRGTGTPQSVCLSAAVTDLTIGVLQNKPNIGEAAVVRVLGTSKVSCGTPIGMVVGTQVITDANGQATAAATDKDIVIGFCLDDTATTAVGQLKEILITHYKASI
jgi:hypothetical protein